MKKFSFTIIFFALLLLSLNAQSSFRIKVIDSKSSENIEKAIVFIEEIPLPDQETDRYGVVSFQNVPEDRKVRVNVRKKGYVPNQTEIVANRAIKVDNNIIIKIEQEPTSPQVIIYGEVTDKGGNEIEDAIVEVSILGKPYSTKTDNSGNYQIKIDRSVFKSVASFQIEAKKLDCERNKMIESVPQSEIINKNIMLICEGKSGDKNKKTEELNNPDNKSELVNGIEVTVTKCELAGNKLICHLLYENKSTEPSKSIKVIGASNKVIDGNGLSYKSILHQVGTAEIRNGTKTYEIIKGTKAKGRVEFIVGDTNFLKLAALNIVGNFNFYDLQLVKK